MNIPIENVLAKNKILEIICLSLERTGKFCATLNCTSFIEYRFAIVFNYLHYSKTLDCSIDLLDDEKFWEGIPSIARAELLDLIDKNKYHLIDLEDSLI